MKHRGGGLVSNSDVSLGVAIEYIDDMNCKLQPHSSFRFTFYGGEMEFTAFYCRKPTKTANIKLRPGTAKKCQEYHFLQH